jgi:hypothetical protein
MVVDARESRSSVTAVRLPVSVIAEILAGEAKRGVSRDGDMSGILCAEVG